MKVIRITAKKDGFRRAGLTHPARAVEYPAEKFSAGELEALRAESMLVVQELEISEPVTAPELKPLAAEPEAAAQATTLPAEDGDKAKEAEDGGKAATSGSGKPKAGK